MLARIRAEPGWYEAVAKEIAPWLGRVSDIRNAVLQNALDSKLNAEVQREWMKLYGQMVGMPELVPDDEEG